MALTHNERQQRYRDKLRASRDGNTVILLEILLELRALRDLVTLRLQESRDILLTPSLKNPSDIESYKKVSVEAGLNRRAAVRVRGTRLPASWNPSPEEREFAAAWSLDPDITADRFRNYWVPKTGRDATKLDWSRTWQNWCMNEKHAKQPNGHANGHAVSQLSAVQIAEIEDHKRWIRESLRSRENPESLV